MVADVGASTVNGHAQPSSGTSKSLNEPIKRAKGATRTYGRPKPIVVEPDSSSSVADAPTATPANQDQQTSSDALALHARDVVQTCKKPQNREHLSEEPFLSTDPLLGLSSPPSHKSAHTTDPTSEEDLSSLSGVKAPERRVTNQLASSSDVEMADEEEDDDDEAPGALAFLRQKVSLSQEMAKIDKQFDDSDALKTLQPQVAPAIREQLGARSGSVLTSLVPTSEQTVTPAPTKRDLVVRSSESDDVTATARKPPVLQATSSEVQIAVPEQAANTIQLSSTSLAPPAADQDSDEDEPVAATAARPKATRHRIVDSDGEEGEGDNIAIDLAAPSTDFPENVARSKPSSIRDSSESDALSRKQRLQQLASKARTVAESKKQKGKEKQVNDVQDSDGDDESGNDDEREMAPAKADKKAGKPKPLSKKAEELQQLQLAQAKATSERNKPEHRLAPRVKERLKVADVFKLRPRPLDFARPRETSSDPIEPASDTPPKHRGKHAAVNSRREITISRDIVKAPALTLATPLENSKDDDDDDMLGTAEEEMAKEQKRLEAKKFLERKKAEAARAQKQKVDTVTLSSEDEVEIVGAASPTRTNGRSASVALAAATPNATTEKQRRMRELTMGPGSHEPTSSDDEVTDSQMARAGHTFGLHLGGRNRVEAARKPLGKRPSFASGQHHRSKQPATINQDDLNHNLLKRAQNQNIVLNQEKRAAYRKHQLEEREKAREGELQKVDVNGLLTKKSEDVKQVDQDEDEDEDDGDYKGSEDDEEVVDFEREELGSVAEDDGVASGDDQGLLDREADEGDAEPAEVTAAAKSVQTSKEVADDDEDDEDVFTVPTARKSKARVRIASDDEAEEQEEARDQTSALPSFMQKKDDDGGLSQFFDSQFDADFGNNDDTEGFGFARKKTPLADGPAPTLMGHLYISDKDRAEDVALLEARGGAMHDVEATPKEAAAPRQYINKLGMLTQTRPAHMYGDSPGDESPGGFTQLLGLKRTLSDPTDDSQPITITQTQLVDEEDRQPKTPTQLDKRAHKLRRAGALVGYGKTQSLGDDIAEEDEEQEADGEKDTQEPTAAQSAAESAGQPANAFDKMLAAARSRGAEDTDDAPAKDERRKKGKSAFIEGEAVLSDEEEGGLFGGVSGDEDEGGLDAELESLVDNEKVDDEEEAEQDLLARERAAEDLAKDDQAALDRAQRVVDGKERKKRTNGLDLSDDEFDDEYGRMTKRREKRTRLDNMTVQELNANEATKAFAGSMIQGTTFEAKPDEFGFLHAAASDDEVGSDEEEGYGDDDAYMRDDVDDVEERRTKVKQTVSHQEAMRQAVERSRARQAQVSFSDEREGSIDLDELVEVRDRRLPGDPHISGIYTSSSPQIHLKISDKLEKRKSQTVQANEARVFKMSHTVDDFADLDSQGLFSRKFSNVKYQPSNDAGGRSAGGDGMTAGAGSAVTSYKKTNLSRSGSTASTNGSGRALSKNGSGSLGPVGGAGGAPLRARSSISTFRKSGFA
ncbi:hypothetical protein ACM66B_006057 [Microbotryomycetes sp. NB124-2]